MKRRLLVLALISLLLITGSLGVSAQEFDWRAHEGTTLRLLMNMHPYTDALLANLSTFEELTGIKVEYDIYPEQNYFDVVTVNLSSGSSSYDVFMTGAYQVWQYAPPGWMEPLEPFMNDPAKTNPEWDVEDFYPNLLEALRWSLVVGEPLGQGSQWALPWAFEANALIYRYDLFDEYGLTPPTSLPELRDTAVKLTTPDRAGIVVRGSRNWATIHPGFMTSYASYGAVDYDEDLNPAMNSEIAVEMTDLWIDMVREAGPSAWTSYTWYQAGADLGAGEAAILFDADIQGFFQNVPGESAMAGRLAWAPGPKGPTGDLKTNMWIWSLAMNAYSKQKDAAWYFLQWATSKEHTAYGALEELMVDPVRISVAESDAFKNRLADHKNFHNTLQEIIDDTDIYFTPQPLFFETTTEWSAALHDIYFERGSTQDILDNLVKKIEGMWRQRGVTKGLDLAQ